ncbi:MAG: DMT family transporter [Anaerolineaceae bacterium]|nr:DMT family transporter [Anaerolineaceae bacterium]
MSAHRRAVLQALLVTFLWSTSWVLIKIGLVELPALTFAGLRYTLACLCLLPLFLRSPAAAALRNLAPGQWGRLALLGVVMYTLTQGAQFLALTLLPTVTVNLALSLTSIVVALLGISLLGERSSRVQWAGIIISVVGAVVYLYPVQLAGNMALGMGVAVLGMVSNAAASLLGRSINRSSALPPLAVTVVSMGIGGPLLLVGGLLQEPWPALSWSHWLIVAWLAVVNTAFAFTLWNHTLRTLSAAESSVINNSMLVQIPLLAVIFLGESLSAQEVAGLAVAVVGMLAVQLGGRRTTVRKAA